MALESGSRFLDYVKASGNGAAGLHKPTDAGGPKGIESVDLVFLDTSAYAKGGGKGPPTFGGGGDGEVVTTIYVAGLPDTDDYDYYNIEIQFVGTWSEDLKAIFIAAADYLASLIKIGLEDAFDSAGKIYDDLVITADIDAIDGTGGILGQAGPTGIRADGYDAGLPAVGEMTFDEADVATYLDLGLFDDIVLHEMMHVMGLGTMWDYFGLVTTVVDDNNTKKPTDDIVTSIFNGTAANTSYDGDPDSFLFVETDGGSGTAGGHWDEETYLNELMTGYIDGSNYLSDWSVASLTDLTYVLVEGAAGLPSVVLIEDSVAV